MSKDWAIALIPIHLLPVTLLLTNHKVFFIQVPHMNSIMSLNII